MKSSCILVLSLLALVALLQSATALPVSQGTEGGRAEVEEYAGKEDSPLQQEELHVVIGGDVSSTEHDDVSRERDDVSREHGLAAGHGRVGARNMGPGRNGPGAGSHERESLEDDDGPVPGLDLDHMSPSELKNLFNSIRKAMTSDKPAEDRTTTARRGEGMGDLNKICCPIG